MRILVALPSYAPEGGGLARYAHEILSRLVARGHEVQALAFTREPARRETVAGVPVVRLQARWTLGNAPLDPSFVAHVRHAHRALRPTVVVAHTPVPGPAELAYLATRRWDTPFVTTYHAGRLRSDSRVLGGLASLHATLLEPRMLRGSARLVAVSRYVADHSLREHGARTRIVPPGVDAARFRPAPAPNRPHILFVGPLSRRYRWKGVDTLWAAFQRVRAALPEARMTLVGNGDRSDEFRNRSRRLDGAVRVLGRVSEDQLVRCYQESSVLALPSRNDAEAFGMVLLEANACARPVVASRVGGIPGYVRDQVNGLLSPPGDPDALADALLRVLEDGRLARRLGVAGRRLAKAEHDWDRLTTATERVLDEAVANGQAPTGA